MKKLILFMLIFSALAFSKAKAQQMYSDPNFLKCALHLYNAISFYDKAYYSENQETKVKELLPEIKQSVSVANQHFKFLGAKYSSDKEFKMFEENVKAMQKSCEFVTEEDKNWIMLYTLVKLNLQELLNHKLK